MRMEMTIEEKDSLLARTIGEHHSTQKGNLTYIPVEHLNAKGFDISDSQNALWRLKDKGAIKSYRHCWGFFEVTKGKRIFEITSTDDPKTDEDFEVYEVEVVPGRLAQAAKSPRSEAVLDGAIILRLNAQGDLYREPKEKFCYLMSGKGIPLKILKHFADQPNTDYEQDTAVVAATIGMSKDQLRKEINKMNAPIKRNLKLKSALIEGRQGSGYRLDPNVEIVLEN